MDKLRTVRRTRSASVVAWIRLARVYQRIDRASSQHLRGWSLSVAQFDVLAHVGTEGGTTQQELARALLVTKGNVCQLLDRLEQRGLLRRREEGRANRLFLTPSGRALLDQVVPAQERFIESQLGALESSQQRVLRTMLRTLEHQLARSCPAASGETP